MIFLTDYCSDKFFERWLEEYRDSDNFEDNIGFSNHENFLDELEEEDLSLEEIENLFNKEVEKYAYEYFQDRIYECTYDIEEKIEGRHIILCRAIVCNRKRFIKNCESDHFPGYSGIGVYWSWDHSKAEAHWADSKNGSELVEIFAKVAITDINWDETILLNLSPSLGIDEAEIRLHEGAQVDIIKIDDEEYHYKCSA